MRIALSLSSLALALVLVPWSSQAVTSCTGCPEIANQTLGVTSAGPNVRDGGPPLSRREKNEQRFALRQMLLVSALEGAKPPSGGDDATPDLGGDGGTTGGGSTGGGSPVPEPATGLMTALGLMSLAIRGRRRA